MELLDGKGMAFEDFKNERPPKRGLWNPQGDRGGGNGGSSPSLGISLRGYPKTI